MSRRFRPTDAFVDESIRGQRYLMGCVLIEARDLAATRAAIGVLPTRGRRLHFNNEVDAQKRILLASIAELPVRAFVVVCHRRHGITEFIAREACLAALVSEVQSQRHSSDRRRRAAAGRSSRPRKPAGRSRGCADHLQVETARAAARLRAPHGAT